jgi:hypothetical protein
MDGMAWVSASGELISAAALGAAIVSPAYARPAAGQANVLVLPLTRNNLWVLTADPG